jgi:biotin carboxylase
MTEAPRVREPLLAIVFSSRSRPWTEIVEAGEGLCRFLWIVDGGEQDLGDTLKVLRRFGTIIDTTQRTPENVIQRVQGEHPDGIISFFDTDLHRHAWMAAALGLPSPSVRAATRLRDKLLQREALEAAGVPGPRFSAVSESVDRREIERLSGALRFPMVIKPRDGTAGRDVLPVADADELTRILAEVDRPSEMILEERMEDLPPSSAPYADRISIDSIVSRGVFSHIGITGLFPMVEPFRSSGGFFPADLPDSDVPELFAMTTAAIQALGADFGCYRTEIKLTPEGHKIIEVNGRPSGLTPVNVQLASGLPLLRLCMRLGLGEHVVVEGPIKCDRVAYRFYCEPPMSAQKYIGSTGLQELSKLPGVVQIDLHKSSGDTVDWRNGSLDKIFQVTGAVADHAELAEHYRACTEDVVVTYKHTTASARPSGLATPQSGEGGI